MAQIEEVSVGPLRSIIDVLRALPTIIRKINELVRANNTEHP